MVARYFATQSNLVISVASISRRNEMNPSAWCSAVALPFFAVAMAALPTVPCGLRSEAIQPQVVDPESETLASAADIDRQHQTVLFWSALAAFVPKAKASQVSAAVSMSDLGNFHRRVPHQRPIAKHPKIEVLAAFDRLRARFFRAIQDGGGMGPHQSGQLLRQSHATSISQANQLPQRSLRNGSELPFAYRAGDSRSCAMRVSGGNGDHNGAAFHTCAHPIKRFNPIMRGVSAIAECAPEKRF